MLFLCHARLIRSLMGGAVGRSRELFSKPAFPASGERATRAASCERGARAESHQLMRRVLQRLWQI